MQSLEHLIIDGNDTSIYESVRQLNYPHDHQRRISLTAAKCRADDILTTLGGLARDHFRGQGRTPDHARNTRPMLLQVHFDPDQCFLGWRGEVESYPLVGFTAHLRQAIAHDNYVQLCADFVANLPVEEVTYFGGELSMDITRKILSSLANITELHLVGVQMEPGFLQPEQAAVHPCFPFQIIAFYSTTAPRCPCGIFRRADAAERPTNSTRPRKEPLRIIPSQFRRTVISCLVRRVGSCGSKRWNRRYDHTGWFTSLHLSVQSA